MAMRFACNRGIHIGTCDCLLGCAVSDPLIPMWLSQMMHFDSPALTHQLSCPGRDCRFLFCRASACSPLPSCCLTASTFNIHQLPQGRQQS